MAKPTPPKKRATAAQPASSTDVSRLLVLMENTQSQVPALAEAVTGLDRRITEMPAQIFKHMDERLVPIEIAVRQNSAEIRKNSEDIRQISEDIRRVESKLDGKANQLDVVALTERVTALERA